MAHSYGATEAPHLLLDGDSSALFWTLSGEKTIRQYAMSLHRGGAECEMLRLLTAAKLRPDILPAVQHAHDQHAVGLRLVKNHVAVMHDAAQAFGL